MNSSTGNSLPVYAAIDLGSNSFHMLVATPEGNSIRKIDSLRMPTRLAAGLDKNKRLLPETETLALDALAQYSERLRDVPLKNIRIVGTSTLRRAKKRENFMRQAHRLLGKPIEIISGREEARLIYSAVSHTYPESEQRRLVLDIGGGSTELALGIGANPALMESVNMGCVSYTNLYFDGGDTVTATAMKKAVTEAQLELQPLTVAYKEFGWDEVVGCSGTIKAVARMLAELAITDGTITREGLRTLARLIISTGSAASLKLTCISQSRTQVIAGGIAVLRAIMKTLNIERIHASQVALREGLIFDMLGKAEHLDIQSQTIANLTARYSIDIRQANRVEQTAIKLFNHVADTWKLDGDTDLQLLVWAAKLHELGMGVSHTQYHKHGAYILENSDLLGFTQAEQTALAILVRYHRRKIEHEAFDSLMDDESHRLSLLLSLLRLSALLHRGRYDDSLEDVNVIIKADQITVVAPQAWLDEHPLTYAELIAEAERLTHVNIKLKAEHSS